MIETAAGGARARVGQAAVVAAMAVALAGCDGASSGTSAGASPSSSPAAVGRWSGLAGQCPTLSAGALAGLGTAAQARVLEPAGSSEVRKMLCTWRPDQRRPYLTVGVSIYQAGFVTPGSAEDSAAHVFDGLRTDAADADAEPITSEVRDQPGRWDEGFLHVDSVSDSAILTIRVDNALVHVRIYGEELVGDDPVGQLRQLRSRYGQRVTVLAAEVIDDLR